MRLEDYTILTLHHDCCDIDELENLFIAHDLDFSINDERGFWIAIGNNTMIQHHYGPCSYTPKVNDASLYEIIASCSSNPEAAIQASIRTPFRYNTGEVIGMYTSLVSTSGVITLDPYGNVVS